MKNINKKIGFIGAGTMGEAMISALLQTGVSSASLLKASDVNSERLNTIKQSYGIEITDNFSLFSSCDVVIMAVKPYQVAPILQTIAENEKYGISSRKIVISIAAGITISKIEKFLYSALDDISRSLLPIIRVMPNTPSLVLAGMSGMSPNSYTSADDLETAGSILNAMGSVIEFREDALDAVTAISGSGPAYLFYYVESMIEAGINVGLSQDDTTQLVLTTIKGAVKLIEERRDSPQNLRKQVTTPGGTTEAALKVLESKHFKEAIIEAIAAASERARELGSR